jgi:glutamine synthetase
MTSLSDTRSRLEDDGIEFILVQFVDIHGAAKVKMVPAGELENVVGSGAGFAGAAVWGLGQGPHSHDMMARVDLDTYTPLSWMPNTARFAASLFVDGEPHPHCARTNLIRVLDEVRSQGYEFLVGMEPEHFLVTRREDGSIGVWDPETIDSLSKPCYDFRSMAPAMRYLQELTSSLNRLGWGVYQTDHEDANGQFEVNFEYDDALTTSDRITFFKMAASQIAGKYDAIATFMPKPFRDRTGSGLHVHFNLADAKTRKNIFRDDADVRGLDLSQTAYHFLGGVLRHARALAAVTSPTVNCYKRLQVGAGLHSSRSGFTWTPAFISYGDNNRTQMIRTPPGGHCEDRTVSSAANPYLALAAYVSAGMDGVKNSIDPGEPNLGNLYARSPEEIRESGIGILPQSLGEAIEELCNDEVVKAGLGAIADEFIELKTREWETYDKEVTAWEIDRYLTFF